MAGIMNKFVDMAKSEYKPKDHTSQEVMAKAEVKEKKHFVRTLGDVRVAAEAQRIFNPALPPTVPKGPTAAQMESGTTTAMDTTGNWGTPERTE